MEHINTRDCHLPHQIKPCWKAAEDIHRVQLGGADSISPLYGVIDVALIVTELEVYVCLVFTVYGWSTHNACCTQVYGKNMKFTEEK